MSRKSYAGLMGHPLIEVNSVEEVSRIVAALPPKTRFMILDHQTGNLVNRDLVKIFSINKNYKHFRLREAGAWNIVLRILGDVEVAREYGAFLNSEDLYILSFHSRDVIANVLTRHRALDFLTVDELMVLGSLRTDIGDDAAEFIAPLLNEPSMLTLSTVPYKSLSTHEKLTLSDYKFSRFFNPISDKPLVRQLTTNRQPSK